MANPTLRQGSKGVLVQNLQRTLNSLSDNLKRPDFNVGGADGVFGAKTALGIKNFQNAMNLTPDGVVGPMTWDAITQAGESIFKGRPMPLKPPLKASQMPPAARTLKIPPPPPGGFDLASLTGDMDWKLVGLAITIGLGALYFMKRR